MLSSSCKCVQQSDSGHFGPQECCEIDAQQGFGLHVLPHMLKVVVACKRSAPYRCQAGYRAKKVLQRQGKDVSSPKHTSLRKPMAALLIFLHLWRHLR